MKSKFYITLAAFAISLMALAGYGHAGEKTDDDTKDTEEACDDMDDSWTEGDGPRAEGMDARIDHAADAMDDTMDDAGDVVDDAVGTDNRNYDENDC